MLERWKNPAIGFATVLLAGGCYGGLDLEASGGGQSDSAGSGGDTEGDSTSGETGDTGGYDQSELPAPTTRVYRLTHRQWENTVQDLFYLSQPTGFSDNFRADPAESGYIFENNALGLEVDGALWSGYQRAAADVAVLVASDASTLDAISPPDTGDVTARGEAFIREFGPRVYRRPVTEGEVAELLTTFNDGPDLYSDMDGYEAGVRMVLEVMLQSPHFVYRIESSTDVSGGVIPLDDYEVASRLSYFLWNSMPDEALFQAAADGDLRTVTGVEPEARRMLEDPRAREVVELFHDTIFEVEEFEGIAPAPAFFPDAPATLGASAAQELRLFIDGVVFDQVGGVADLLTSTKTFVNDDLATIYGIEGSFGSEFEEVDLDPSQRKGILTQVGFLAHNSTSVNPDPIHRGVFLVEDITCTPIPAPPDGAPPLPPPQNKTNRQTVEEHTGVDGCAQCHNTIINPYGFPFENYDATGAFRTQDAGMPVDASSSVTLDGEQVPVDNAIELIDALADSPKVHACYFDHWVQYAHGRPAAPEDEPLVERLGAASQEEAASVQDLIVEIVSAQPFLTRAAEELE